jgi:hypothetical protein
MDAMKCDRDFARAARLFREALALNPTHEPRSAACVHGVDAS